MRIAVMMITVVSSTAETIVTTTMMILDGVSSPIINTYFE